MAESDRPSRGGRRLRRLAVAYLALLAVSHLVWLTRDEQRTLPEGMHALALAERDGVAPRAREVSFAYEDSAPGSDAPVVILLHGNPGDGRNFASLSARLEERYRILAPDLPGFGASTLRVADYSIEAHAAYLLEAMDRLEVERAHLVGFSMGGGVALHVARSAPERVASIVMLASIGVQELELFGSYELNRAVHAIQLAAIHGASALLPHFGALERSFFNVPYARNFFDTDQRPLRGLLESYAGPMLIVHGERDFLVPPAAAREHHRLVPQSELVMRADKGHFLVWTWTAGLADAIDDFVGRAETGEAATRADADSARIALASAPWDPAGAPPFEGPTLLFAVVLLALATLVSEDLTCIGAGLLVAQGRIGFVAATLACFAGIFIGDVMLYFVGRIFGRPALRRAPLRWWISPVAVERASNWFRERGGAVIFLSRFAPGMRLSTYLVAGILRTRFAVFALYFCLAGLVWTPALVGFASWAGLEASEALELFGDYALVGLVLLVLVLFLAPRVVLSLFTFRGRRKLLGRWKRLVHFEFWPAWAFYSPVVLYVAWLAIRHRGLGTVAAANPCIPTGGFIGESKARILEAFGDDECVAPFVLLDSRATAAERVEAARSFMRERGLSFPIVLKPDVGQRGSGVRIVRDDERLVELLEHLPIDSILQEFAAGPEFGLFYYRMPNEPAGHLFSITEKHLPRVVGDGQRTLEELILADDRAVAMADTYLDANAERLASVPAPGEELELVQLGTHCLGAIFLDGERLITPELERAVDELSQHVSGFYFGRYDVRVKDAETLARGRNFKVIELNGVTSEATHIYDPRHGVLYAWRTLFRQWSLAFQIAEQNRGRAPSPSLRELWREWRSYRRLQTHHRTSRRP